MFITLTLCDGDSKIRINPNELSNYAAHTDRPAVTVLEKAHAADSDWGEIWVKESPEEIDRLIKVAACANADLISGTIMASIAMGLADFMRERESKHASNAVEKVAQMIADMEKLAPDSPELEVLKRRWNTRGTESGREESGPARRRICTECAHHKTASADEPCASCLADSSHNHPKWEGVQ